MRLMPHIPAQEENLRYRNTIYGLIALYLLMPVTSQAGDILTVDQAVKQAVAHNPKLAATQAHAHALTEVPPQVGTLPDPRLSFDASNLPVNTFSTTQENMTQLRLGLSQGIPFPGKLGLKRNAARLEAEAAASSVDEMRLKLTRDVRIHWWNLFYLDRALEIVQVNQALLRKFITIAQTKYKVGKGLQQDVLLAQLELSKMLDIQIRLKGSRESARARLNAMMNRPADMAIRLPEKIDEHLHGMPQEKVLRDIAMRSRPLFEGRREEVKAARTRARLAEKDYYPDFRVGAAYGFRQGNNPATGVPRADLASIGISLNLPVYSSTKQDRAVAQREAETVRAEFSLQDARDIVWKEISTALADYQTNSHQVELFKTGIIPQATQTVSSMLAGYQVNKVDFLNLIRAQITLYNYQTQYWQALAGARQSMARLEAAVGKENIDE